MPATVEIADAAVWQADAKLQVGRFQPRQASAHPRLHGCPIVRVNQTHECLGGRNAHIRRDPKKTIRFGRPRDHALTVLVRELPTAEMGNALRFGQQILFRLQFLFRPFPFRDVTDENKTSVLALMEEGYSEPLDVENRPVEPEVLQHPREHGRPQFLDLLDCLGHKGARIRVDAP